MLHLKYSKIMCEWFTSSIWDCKKEVCAMSSQQVLLKRTSFLPRCYSRRFCLSLRHGCKLHVTMALVLSSFLPLQVIEWVRGKGIPYKSIVFDILMLAIYRMNQDHKLVRLYQILLCAFLYLLRKSVEFEAIKQNKNRPSNKPLGRRRVTKPPLKNMLNLQV